MNRRRKINEQIHRHRSIFFPMLGVWVIVFPLGMFLHAVGSIAGFLLMPTAFILTIGVIVAFFGGAPSCPNCGGNFNAAASRYAIAVRWKKLPESITACPKCGVTIE